MQNAMQGFLAQKNIAIVGSFRHPDKPAYRILAKFKREGYNIFPVNPTLSEVEGLKCYPSIIMLPDNITAANIVTPPAVTEKLVQECADKNIGYVWLQPGAESEKAIEDFQNNGIHVVHGVCIMLEDVKR